MDISAKYLEDPAMLIVADQQLYPADHAFDNHLGIGCYTIELTYSGTMLRRSGSMTAFLPQPNDTLLLTPPHTPYGLRGRQPGTEIWLIFECPDALQHALDWPCGSFGIPELPVPRTPLGRQMLQAMEEACHYMAGRLPLRQKLAENALERLLLLAASLSPIAAETSDKRIRAALTLMEQQAHTCLTVAHLARVAGLSPSHFAHRFRELIGLTPMQHLESIRMAKAQSLLLKTDLQIKQIADRVGFEDPYYFCTRFRQHTGCAPSAWRKQPHNPPHSATLPSEPASTARRPVRLPHKHT